MDPKELLGNVPWITKDGNLDMTRFPIDNVLRQTLSQDDQEFRTGLNLLSSMCGYGRTEAGVFLMGVLLNCDDNWEKRITIVEAMRFIKTKPCADLLFGEVKRVKSSNTTRRYLATVIKVLSSMPSELVKEGFRTLAEDRSFSPKMRDKFRAVLEKRLFGNHGW
jgi:predicted ABC-type exoprotein transport system permease subunit